tara:strand:- start:5622 stop:6380 length:759 start_codon:yes stop_codon:yes gene_type:complete
VRNTTYSQSTITGYSKSTTTTWNSARTTTWSTTIGTLEGTGTTYSWNTFWNTSQSTDDGMCIVGGTLIHVSATETKPVEDLILNEPILTMDGPHNIEVAGGLEGIETTTIADNLSYDDVLVASIRTQVIGTIDINNGLIKTTAKHLHIVKKSGKWVARQAQTVAVGDYLYHITDGEILVTSVTEDTTTEHTVYKLDIEPNDVFFANGILTHNAKPRLCNTWGPEVCDPGSLCYDPCADGAWEWGCQFECRPM